MRRFPLAFLLTMFVLTCACCTCAQSPAGGGAPASSDTGGSKTTESSNSVTDSIQQPGFQADGGYLVQLGKHLRNSFYYKLQYNDQVLTQQGKAFAPPNFPPPTQTPAKVDPGGDTNSFAARLEQDSLTTTGSLFNVLKVQPLIFPPNSLFAGLRGAAQVTGKFNPNTLSVDHVDYAVGLETGPLHPLRLLNERYRLGVTNWVVFGVEGGTQSQDKSQTVSTGPSSTNSTNTHDVSMATYRSFFAVSPGTWVVSDAQKMAEDNIAAYNKTLAPDYTTLGENVLVNKTVPSDTGQPKSALVQKEDQVLQEAFESEFNTAFGFTISRNGPVKRAIPLPLTVSNKIKQDVNRGIYDVDAKMFLDELDVAHKSPGNRSLPENVKLAVADVVWKEYTTEPDFSTQKPLIDAYFNADPRPSAISDATADAVCSLLSIVATDRLFANPADAGVTKNIPPAALPASVSEIGQTDPLKQFKQSHDKDINKRVENDVDQHIRAYADRYVLQYAFSSIHELGPKADVPSGSDLWNDKLTIAAADFLEVPDRPTVTLWLTDSGWYTMSGKPASPGRFSNLLNTALRFYLTPGAVSPSWIEIQYENGRDRAAPSEYSNFVSVNVGFNIK